MKRVGPAIWRHVVARSRGRLRSQVLVEAQQRLEHLANDGGLSGKATAVRVDVVRLTLQEVNGQLLGGLLREHRMCGGGYEQRASCQQIEQAPNKSRALLFWEHQTRRVGDRSEVGVVPDRRWTRGRNRGFARHRGTATVPSGLPIVATKTRRCN